MNGQLSVVFCAMFLTVAFAGCGGSDDGAGGGSPSPTTTTGTSPAPTDPPPPAGNALRSNYTFQPSANIPEATFTISTNWSQLSVALALFKTSSCGVLQAEPPTPPSTTQTPAQVTLTSPTGKKVGPLALGTVNTCDQSSGTTKLPGTLPTGNAASEMGTWKVLVNGRGVNVQVEVWVAGK